MKLHPMAMVITVMLMSAIGNSLQAQDASAGERVFKSQCSVCHSVTPGRNIIGPSLANVVGRRVGAVPGFHYTDANRNSGLIWDPQTLDRYLANPRNTVPGTAMTYAGLRSDDQRRNLIAYLATLH